MTPTKKPLRFQRFRRITIFGWRYFWRCISGNNEIIIPGGEGYINKGDVSDTIDRLIEKIQAGEYIREDV